MGTLVIIWDRDYGDSYEVWQATDRDDARHTLERKADKSNARAVRAFFFDGDCELNLSEIYQKLDDQRDEYEQQQREAEERAMLERLKKKYE